MITANDIALLVTKTTTKTGKDILVVYMTIRGFAYAKYIAFKRKNDKPGWVLSEDTNREDNKEIFSVFDGETKKGYQTLKLPEFKVKDTKLSLALSGVFFTDPKFDKWGKEYTTAALTLDQGTVDYYTAKQQPGDKFFKNYVLEDNSISLDDDTLKLIEENSFKEFNRDDFSFFYKTLQQPTTAGVGF